MNRCNSFKMRQAKPKAPARANKRDIAAGIGLLLGIVAFSGCIGAIMLYIAEHLKS